MLACAICGSNPWTKILVFLFHHLQNRPMNHSERSFNMAAAGE